MPTFIHLNVSVLLVFFCGREKCSAFRCAMQFCATSYPTQPSRRFIGSCPGKVSELREGDIGFWIVGSEFIRREPGGFLFSVLCPETGAAHGHHNGIAVHFDFQVRVGHLLLPASGIRPTPDCRIGVYGHALRTRWWVWQISLIHCFHRSSDSVLPAANGASQRELISTTPRLAVRRPRPLMGQRRKPGSRFNMSPKCHYQPSEGT